LLDPIEVDFVKAVGGIEINEDTVRTELEKAKSQIKRKSKNHN
jgi:hypothetical protein